MEFLEHQFAVADMRRDSESGVQRVPDNVLFSVYAGNWHSCSTGQEVYCRPFRPLVQPFRAWAEELEDSSVRNCIRHAMRKLAQTE